MAEKLKSAGDGIVSDSTLQTGPNPWGPGECAKPAPHDGTASHDDAARVHSASPEVAVRVLDRLTNPLQRLVALADAVMGAQYDGEQRLCVSTLVTLADLIHELASQGVELAGSVQDWPAPPARPGELQSSVPDANRLAADADALDQVFRGLIDIGAMADVMTGACRAQACEQHQLCQSTLEPFAEMMRGRAEVCLDLARRRVAAGATAAATGGEE